MSIYLIKENEESYRKVFEVLENKRRAVHVRNKIRGLIHERFSRVNTPFDTEEDFDGVAQELEIAPIDLKRTRAAMCMALSESLTVDVLCPDGKNGRSFVNISLSGNKLAVAFRSYASGQLRKQLDHPLYGQWLTELFQPKQASFDVCFHCQWSCEPVPQAKIDHVTRSTETWFIKLVEMLGNEIVAIVNEEVADHV